jgi:hypothetical protein
MKQSMRLRIVVVILISLLSCAKRENPLKDVLPIQVQREWVLRETQTRSNEDAPEQIRRQGLRRWMIGTYHGNGTVRVRLFEMNVEASAFESAQKWHDSTTQAFHKGPCFVVVDSVEADRQTLSAFVQELQNTLNVSGSGK